MDFRQEGLECGSHVLLLFRNLSCPVCMYCRFRFRMGRQNYPYLSFS